jgi:hypothetical protein
MATTPPGANDFMSDSNRGPAFMMAVAIVFSFAVAYIADRRISG